MQVKSTTANEAYENAHERAVSLVNQIQEMLSNLPSTEETVINWGHVGDLHELNVRLSSALEMINR